MKKPFGLKLEIHDPELGGLLGGGPNRVLVSKNASIGNIRATTTDPAASKLGAIGKGGIEGKYRVSIFQGSAPLTHESFRSKKNAIAYAVDWKKRKDRNLGFSAKLRLRELARGDFLRQVIGYSDLVPARGTTEAAKGAGKLRYYRSNPAGKEIERVRKEILADPNLRESSKFKDTPGLTIVDEYDEAHHFPKRSRDTKYVIDNLNKHAARGKSWSVKKGMLGQPIVRAEGIERILCAKLRLREFGLLGHPLEYSRPYIYGDRRLPRGEGAYEAPEAFRLNNQGESFARGQEAAIAKARKGGVISVGLKKTTKGGWRAIAQENGLTRAADAKRSVLRHELIHSIQRAKAASQGKSYVRGMMNPIKRYVAEVGAYAAENRRRPGRGLVERLFPTFKAVLSAKGSI